MNQPCAYSETRPTPKLRVGLHVGGTMRPFRSCRDQDMRNLPSTRRCGGVTTLVKCLNALLVFVRMHVERDPCRKAPLVPTTLKDYPDMTRAAPEAHDVEVPRKTPGTCLSLATHDRGPCNLWKQAPERSLPVVRTNLTHQTARLPLPRLHRQPPHSQFLRPASTLNPTDYIIFGVPPLPARPWSTRQPSGWAFPGLEGYWATFPKSCLGRNPKDYIIFGVTSRPPSSVATAATLGLDRPPGCSGRKIHKYPLDKEPQRLANLWGSTHPIHPKQPRRQPSGCPAALAKTPKIT